MIFGSDALICKRKQVGVHEDGGGVRVPLSLNFYGKDLI